MAYLGRQPIVGNYQVLDALTATTTDTYALTKNSVAVFPQTPANCIVSLNGVIQAPFDSYTISGSNIVFASALTGSDSIDFITVLGDVLNVGTVSDGTIGLAKLSATGTKDATTFLRGDNTFQTIGTNTPTFLVRKNGDQSISANTWTKITGWSEIFDPQSTFASDKFTPGVAGKYFIYGYVYLNGISGQRFLVALYKSGTKFVESGSMASSANDYPQLVCGYVDVNDTDYIELYFNSPGGSSSAYSSGITVQWGGYKIIE